MTRLRVAARLLEIHRALVRHGLDDFVRATHLYRPFRFLFYLSPWTWFQRSAGATRGERLRLALEELGPIFVKFGQAVSTRRDLLPVDIADELAKLQDRVPPFESAVAVAAIEQAFGRPLKDIFASFEATPLAAASIAQVHAATLKSGEEVVVKILRPGMHEVIERDLQVLRRSGRARRRILGGRAAAASHRAGERVPQDHSRRARPHARGGQRRSAQAQFRGLDAPLRAGGVLGLLPQQRDGDGAHPRHHREPHG